MVGTILLDLSKAYDCLPHDLLIAKLAAYVVQEKGLQLIYNYLKNRQHRVKIGSTVSEWLEIIIGVPQGSILGPLLFNIFINDIFLFVNDALICNFADDNTLYACDNTVDIVARKLESDMTNILSWFQANSMSANSSKFQLMFLGLKRNINLCLEINGKILLPSKSVKLLGVEIDNKLNFLPHIETMCKKANKKINAWFRIRNFISCDKARLLSSA